MLREEVADVRVLPTDPLADEVVEVADHLAIRAEVLGRHRPDGVAHPLRELVEDLLAQTFDELVVALACVLLEEVVLAQVADPLAEVGREGIEAVEAPSGEVLRHACRVRIGRVFGGPLQAPLHARSLVGHDLLELAPDVAEHVAEVVALAELLASPREAFHEVLEAGQIGAGRIAAPPAAVHEPAQRFGEVTLRHDVVGQRLEDLVGLEVGQACCVAVPAASTRRATRGERGRACVMRPGSTRSRRDAPG